MNYLNKIRRGIALLLSFVMVVSLLPVEVIAQELYDSATSTDQAVETIDNQEVEATTSDSTINEVVDPQESLEVAPEENVYTFEFYDGEDSSATLIEKQSVEDGKLLKEPLAPEKAGLEFLGWYIKDEVEPLDFTKPVLVEGVKTVRVEAQYRKILSAEDEASDDDSDAAIKNDVASDANVEAKVDTKATLDDANVASKEKMKLLIMQ